MSDLMLYGVLRMPFDMAMSGYLSQRQFYDRVQEAARRLEAAEARLAEIDAATPPSPSTAPMCERKTAKLEEEGYAKTGYVLRHPGKDRQIAVSDGGAVSWFTTEQWNWLMFNRDHVEFQWPKPIGALASRPAEVDDEGLPPLPTASGRIYVQNGYTRASTRPGKGLPLFTAEQYRQGQRDAVAADRARREKGGV